MSIILPKDVIIIDPNKDSRWNKFVENHPFGWIVHLSGWKSVLERSFPHIKGHYLTLLDSTGSEIRAALPLFEVRSWLTGSRLVSIPFATICDPLINTRNDIEKLLEGAIDLSIKLKTSYIEIRTIHSVSLIQDNRLASNQLYKHHYLYLDKDPEMLKKTFHRTNIRQRIQRALDSNVSVRIANSESDLSQFYLLHSKTRKKLCLPPQPVSFFKSLWETFVPLKHMTLLLAMYNNQAVAGLILFKFKDRVSAEFLASDEKYLNISPNHLLFWEAIKCAYNEGYKIFDFGRTSAHNESLMSFKNRWGTQVIDMPQLFYNKGVSNKSFDKETSAGYKLIQKLCRNSPEPIFQLIGRICYRHLG
jgi:CelD/BcsL family acetyltransferase involved in cellulose biosynthesis